MGQIVKLVKLVERLAELDGEDIIYACEPWTEDSDPMVAREDPKSVEFGYCGTYSHRAKRAARAADARRTPRNVGRAQVIDSALASRKPPPLTARQQDSLPTGTARRGAGAATREIPPRKRSMQSPARSSMMRCLITGFLRH